MDSLVGCHEAGAKRFVTRHDAGTDEGVDVDTGIKEFFPEVEGFHLVADEDGDDGCARWHERKAGVEQCLAYVIGIGDEPLFELRFGADDFKGGQHSGNTCRCWRSTENKGWCVVFDKVDDGAVANNIATE